MNQMLQTFARQYLKDGLAKLPEGHVDVFRRMYSHKNPTALIPDVVDRMPVEKLDWAMQQVANSLEKQS